jgi:hypothetical protein
MRNLVVVFVLALAAAACGSSNSPSEPSTALDNSFDALVTLQNAAGAPTITGAEALIDGKLLQTDSQSATANETLFPNDYVARGTHTLTIQLTAQTTGATPTTYRVPKFDLTLSACVGNVGGIFVFGDDGGTFRKIHMPEQSGDLVPGQGFSYTFTSPDCVPEGDR